MSRDRITRLVEPGMGTRERLRVRVKEDLVLDAGTCEEVATPAGTHRLIRPSEITLFRQVLEYLRGKPLPPVTGPAPAAAREGLAAAAVTLRWGSYLAVLLDGEKPCWNPPALRENTSRISDEEMARINIESSAALAAWIDLSRTAGGEAAFARLVDAALAYLPMPMKTSKLRFGPFAALADPQLARRLVGASDAARLARARADAERHPSRVFANALVNVAWRNGPVEDIHAGRAQCYPLSRRRVTEAEERKLLRFASDGMTLGLAACRQLAAERPRRPWSEQVLPYGLVPTWLVTPSGWTLTEVSRDVRLPACPSPEGCS